MSETEAQPGHLRTVVNAVCLISFPFGLLYFALPLLGKQMGASALAIAGLYSTFFLMTVLLRPVIGWALDRYGRRPFLLGGLAGYLAANLTFLWADSMGLLYLGRIAQSIGSSLTWLAAYAIVADLSPVDKRGRYFGRVEQASSQAILVGVFVFFTIYTFLDKGSILTDDGAMHLAWMVSFGLFAALGLYAIWRARSLPETGNPQGTEPFWQSFRASWGRLSRPLLVLMAIVLLTSAAFQAVSPLVLIFLQERFGASMMELALAYLPMALIWAVFPSRMGAIGDRLGRKLPMAAGLLVSGAVILFLPHAPSLLLLAILWAVEALAFTASVPAEEALVADLSGSEQRGESFGLYTFASGLGAVVGPLVGGWLYDQVGHSAPFYFTAALVFVGALLIVLFVREPDRSTPTG
jgi:DHA1 family multidrug resistance protein-like MFS transporter